MGDDPLEQLRTPATDALAARLAGHQLLARGSYTDADVPVLDLDLICDDPLIAAGIDDDGAFTFHLEVWGADTDAVVLITDTGDEPGELDGDADDLVADIEALLAQALGHTLTVSALVLVEYPGSPQLIWERPA